MEDANREKWVAGTWNLDALRSGKGPFNKRTLQSGSRGVAAGPSKLFVFQKCVPHIKRVQVQLDNGRHGHSSERDCGRSSLTYITLRFVFLQ